MTDHRDLKGICELSYECMSVDNSMECLRLQTISQYKIIGLHEVLHGVTIKIVNNFSVALLSSLELFDYRPHFLY